jgi:hypothetical protein
MLFFWLRKQKHGGNQGILVGVASISSSKELYHM